MRPSMKSGECCHRFYEQRVIAYVDILGWSEACKTESDNLIETAQAIDDAAIRYCRFTKAKIRNITNNMNPIYDDVQFGAFSDNFAVSMHAKSGYRIIVAAAEVCRKLLHIGFLTRGGITIGKLHHVDNVIFGPALIDAVRLEKEAVYPRLLCSPELVDHLETFSKGWENELIIVDHLGRKIANLFEPIGILDTGQPMDHGQMHGIPAIEKIIEGEIQRHIQNRSEKRAEKWRYMREVLPMMLDSPANKKGRDNESSNK
jgi:hypothetical protein